MNDECSVNLSFSVHDKITWQIMTKYNQLNDELQIYNLSFN